MHHRLSGKPSGLADGFTLFLLSLVRSLLFLPDEVWLPVRHHQVMAQAVPVAEGLPIFPFLFPDDAWCPSGPLPSGGKPSGLAEGSRYLLLFLCFFSDEVWLASAPLSSDKCHLSRGKCLWRRVQLSDDAWCQVHHQQVLVNRVV